MGNRKSLIAIWLNIVLLLFIAIASSMGALHTDVVLEAFSLSEEAFFFPVIITFTILSSLAFLILIKALVSWFLRNIRSFKSFQRKQKATVTVEFMLAFPILIYMCCTLFSLAEIAHAQLVFRYATFSAARAGAVTNNFIKIPPNLSKYDPDRGILSGLIDLPEKDKTRMRAAAVIALAGIDCSGSKSSDNVLNDFNVDPLGKIYSEIGSKTTNWKYGKTPWVDSKFFKKRFYAADQSLVTFKPDCICSGIIQNPLKDLIDNILSKLIKDPIFDKLDKLKDLEDKLNKILKLLGIPEVKIVHRMIDFLDKVFEYLLMPVKKIIKWIIDLTHIDVILSKIRIPLVPPEVTVEMEYELKLRKASLFWLICPKGTRGYPCVTLARNASASDTTPMKVRSSGARIDMPVIPPFLILVNLMYGDSTFGSNKYTKDDKKEK